MAASPSAEALAKIAPKPFTARDGDGLTIEIQATLADNVSFLMFVTR